MSSCTKKILNEFVCQLNELAYEMEKIYPEKASFKDVVLYSTKNYLFEWEKLLDKDHLKYCFEIKDNIDNEMGDVIMQYCKGVCPQKLLSEQSGQFVSHFSKANGHFCNHFKISMKNQKILECWNYLMKELVEFHGTMYDFKENQKMTIVLNQNIEKDFSILKFEITIPPGEFYKYQRKSSSKMVIKL